MQNNNDINYMKSSIVNEKDTYIKEVKPSTSYNISTVLRVMEGPH